jgi:hypothetical protein
MTRQVMSDWSDWESDLGNNGNSLRLKSPVAARTNQEACQRTLESSFETIVEAAGEQLCYGFQNAFDKYANPWSL